MCVLEGTLSLRLAFPVENMGMCALGRFVDILSDVFGFGFTS